MSRTMDERVDLPPDQQAHGLTSALGPLTSCNARSPTGARVVEKPSCYEVQTYHRDSLRLNEVIARCPKSYEQAEDAAYAIARLVGYGYGLIDRLSQAASTAGKSRAVPVVSREAVFFWSDRDHVATEIHKDTPLRDLRGTLRTVDEYLKSDGERDDVEVYLNNTWTKGALYRLEDATAGEVVVNFWTSSPAEAKEVDQALRSKVGEILVPPSRSERSHAPVVFQWTARPS